MLTLLTLFVLYADRTVTIGEIYAAHCATRNVIITGLHITRCASTIPLQTYTLPVILRTKYG